MMGSVGIGSLMGRKRRGNGRVLACRAGVCEVFRSEGSNGRVMISGDWPQRRTEIEVTVVLQRGHVGEWLSQVPRQERWNCACWHE